MAQSGLSGQRGPEAACSRAPARLRRPRIPAPAVRHHPEQLVGFFAKSHPLVRGVSSAFAAAKRGAGWFPSPPSDDVLFAKFAESGIRRMIFAHFEGASNDRCLLYYHLGQLRVREVDGLVSGPRAVTIVEVKTALRLSRLLDRQHRDVEQVRRSCELSRQARPTSGLLIQVAGDYVCRGSEALLVGVLDETVRNAGTSRQVRVVAISRRGFEQIAAEEYMTFDAYRRRSLDWLQKRFPALGQPTVGKAA